MTGLQGPQTTSSSLRAEPRSLWRKRVRTETASKFAQALMATSWVWPEPTQELTTKTKVRLACACGKTKAVRVSDVLAGGSKSCRSCALSARMAEERQTPERQAMQAAMTAKAARVNSARHYHRCLSLGVTPSAWKALRARMTAAKQRCSNGHPNYGGRGIRFLFDSPSQAAEWVILHLGLPTPGQSIDRINNDSHYMPGNLRWADRATQSGNRRAYTLNPTAQRIKQLKAQRPDYSYESIRTFVNQGMTHEQILTKVKYRHTTS